MSFFKRNFGRHISAHTWAGGPKSPKKCGGLPKIAIFKSFFQKSLFLPKNAILQSFVTQKLPDDQKKIAKNKSSSANFRPNKGHSPNDSTRFERSQFKLFLQALVVTKTSKLEFPSWIFGDENRFKNFLKRKKLCKRSSDVVGIEPGPRRIQYCKLKTAPRGPMQAGMILSTIYELNFCFYTQNCAF